MVFEGVLTIRLRDRDVHLQKGQFFIIPRGVEHLPVAVEECQVLLFEPDSVCNTGNRVNCRTVKTLQRL